jgi:AcrR family transcriptional regulator
MDSPVKTEASLSRVERKKARTNRKLLEVARQLFSEKGIYWAKVEDITELADQGKGTFYKYFDSKDAIIRALLEEGLGELLTKTEQAVGAAASKPAILAAMIETRVDFFLEHPDHLLLFHQVRGMMQLQVSVAKELQGVYDAHLRRLAQLIKPAMGMGGAGSARDIATAVAAFTSGLLTYHLLFEGPEGIRRRRNYFLQTLHRSLLPLLRNGDGLR